MTRACGVLGCLAVLALPSAARAAHGAVAGPAPAGAWVARVIAPVGARRTPREPRVVAFVGTRARWGGGPVQLLVLRSARVARPRRPGQRRLWLRVALPRRPNGSAAWIPADHTHMYFTRWRIELSTVKRRMVVYHGLRVARSFRVVVGARATPTPHGLFAVDEKIAQRDPTGFLGPWALHLTAFSDVLDDYGGGPGRVAIHGRGAGSLVDPLGSARSHGCIRIDNAPVRWLARVVPLGAPVHITY
jgi:L,D-transpeptidase catalytic domain